MLLNYTMVYNAVKCKIYSDLGFSEKKQNFFADLKNHVFDLFHNKYTLQKPSVQVVGITYSSLKHLQRLTRIKTAIDVQFCSQYESNNFTKHYCCSSEISFSIYGSMSKNSNKINIHNFSMQQSLDSLEISFRNFQWLVYYLVDTCLNIGIPHVTDRVKLHCTL